MKNLIVFLTALLCANYAHSYVQKDTLEVRFSEGGKVIIVAEDRSELIDISRYQLDKIIEDIVDTLQSADQSVSYLVVTETLSSEYFKEEEKTFDFDFNFKRTRDEDFADISNYRGQRLDDKPRRSGRRDYRTTGSFNIDLGVNNYLSSGSFPSGGTPWAVKNWGSWYVSLNYIWNTPVKGKFQLAYGTGFSWYNFKLDNESFFISRGQNQVEYTPADPVAFPDPIRSKITASYFNIYLVPMLDFGKGRRKKKWWSFRNSDGFRIGAGAYGGYRLGSHSKFVWNNANGNKNKTRDRGNLFMNNWRYGVRGQIGYKDIDFFVNYDLNELFEDGRHPAGKLNAISFGIII
jgi:hypothetical protein